MKFHAMIVACLVTFSSYCQTTWILSNIGIPVGYSPNDFAIAANGDIYLAASQWNGSSFSPKLMKSSNNGSSWTEIIMTGLTNVQNTNSLVFSGSKLLLAGSNSNTASYFVYASIDNGLSWTLSNSGIPSGYSPNDFAIAANGDIYLAASQWNGSSFSPKLMKSINSGSSWTEIIMVGLTNVQNTNSLIFCGNKLLMSGSNSSTATYFVYASIDNGLNWTSSNSGIPSGYSVNDFTLKTGQEIYAACSQWNGTGFSPKIIKSTNSGAVWTDITGLTGLTDLQNTNSIIYMNNSLLLSGSNSSTSSYYVYISSITSSIEEEGNVICSIFPNPTHDNLTLNISQKATIEIFNMEGKKILMFTQKNKQSTFDISNLSNGIYIIKVTTDFGLAVRKIIKK
jgi:hypothetical protein